MNRKENGIIAANIIEAGYLRSHSNPFIWAIRNACFTASEKEDRISLFLSLLALLPVPLVCTTVLLLSAVLSNNASFCQKSNVLHKILLWVLPPQCHAAKSRGNYYEGSLVVLTGLSSSDINSIMNRFNTKNDNFAD